MLSQEGKDVAQECAMRSGLVEPGSHLNAESSHVDITIKHNPEVTFLDSCAEKATNMFDDLRREQLSSRIPPQTIERVYPPGWCCMVVDFLDKYIAKNVVTTDFLCINFHSPSNSL